MWTTLSCGGGYVDRIEGGMPSKDESYITILDNIKTCAHFR